LTKANYTFKGIFVNGKAERDTKIRAERVRKREVNQKRIKEEAAHRVFI
jgi:hypothetical protein